MENLYEFVGQSLIECRLQGIQPFLFHKQFSHRNFAAKKHPIITEEANKIKILRIKGMLSVIWQYKFLS